MRAGPPKLADLQAWLRWVFTDPRGPSVALTSPFPGKQPPVRGREPRPRLAPWLSAASQADLERRLDVYANAYFLRLHGVLSAVFPVSKKRMGDSRFLERVADYFFRHPSSSPLIEDAARRFPLFVAGLKRKDEPFWIADLLHLEWAVLESLHAPLSASTSGSVLNSRWAKNVAKAKFHFSSTVKLLTTSSLAFEAWRAEKESGRKKRWPVSKGKKIQVLFFRNSGGVQAEQLYPLEGRVLQKLMQGRTLAAACAGERGFQSEAASRRFQEAVAGWFRRGLVERITVSA